MSTSEKMRSLRVRLESGDAELTMVAVAGELTMVAVAGLGEPGMLLSSLPAAFRAVGSPDWIAGVSAWCWRLSVSRASSAAVCSFRLRIASSMAVRSSLVGEVNSSGVDGVRDAGIG